MKSWILIREEEINEKAKALNNRPFVERDDRDKSASDRFVNAYHDLYLCSGSFFGSFKHKNTA